MTRVHVFCEGQTEETFVRELLYETLQRQGIYINPILVRTSATGRGGVVTYKKIKPQIQRKCLEDKASFVTTMFDLFRLPKDFPGQGSLPKNKDPLKKALYLEDQLKKDVDLNNFFPNLIVHEFEGLLYSNPEIFEEWFNDDVVQRLCAERKEFSSPEHINEGPETAPSKRILRHCPSYEKTVHGTLIACGIGLDAIRGQCKHFDAWVTRLAGLAESENA